MSKYRPIEKVRRPKHIYQTEQFEELELCKTDHVAVDITFVQRGVVTAVDFDPVVTFEWHDDQVDNAYQGIKANTKIYDYRSMERGGKIFAILPLEMAFMRLKIADPFDPSKQLDKMSPLLNPNNKLFTLEGDNHELQEDYALVYLLLFALELGRVSRDKEIDDQEDYIIAFAANQGRQQQYADMFVQGSAAGTHVDPNLAKAYKSTKDKIFHNNAASGEIAPQAASAELYSTGFKSVKQLGENMRTLANLLCSVHSFANSLERRNLVEGWLAGSPAKSTLLGLLDLSGTPMGASINLISTLTQYGKESATTEVFHHILQGLHGQVGIEGKEYIETLYAEFFINQK